LSVERTRRKKASIAAAEVSPAKGDKQDQVRQLATLRGVFEVSVLSRIPPCQKFFAGDAHDPPRHLVEQRGSAFRRKL
ncbi:MAG: hypothetical protein ACRDJC_23205, partial [Thermomicrobiales bacterium]